MYDDLRSVKLPTYIEIIAFADDIALVATTSASFLLEERMEDVLGVIVARMATTGLELAMDKTESIVLTNRNLRNSMLVNFGVHSFALKRTVNYLGMQIDARLYFREHADLACKRVAEAGRQLSRALPNLRDS